MDRDGKIVNEIPLTVEKPDPHRDTRLVRKLDSGNYLVCHESDGCVREYDPKGKVVWSYTLDLAGRARSPGHGPEGHGTDVFGAIRLANGNTVIAGGNNNRVIEVNKEGKVVWSLDQKELPGITLAWVTTPMHFRTGTSSSGTAMRGRTIRNCSVTARRRSSGPSELRGVWQQRRRRAVLDLKDPRR